MGKEIPKLTDEEIEAEKSKYTRKIELPIYEPVNVCPQIKDLCDTTKRDELIKEINDSTELDYELKQFLLTAAERHTVFNFAKIADFYSHIPVKFKKFFENSALVIIDYDSAIRNGFISFDKEVQESREDYLENVITKEKMEQNKAEVAEKRIKKHEEELELLKRTKKPEKTIEEW